MFDLIDIVKKTFNQKFNLKRLEVMRNVLICRDCSIWLRARENLKNYPSKISCSMEENEKYEKIFQVSWSTLRSIKFFAVWKARWKVIYMKLFLWYFYDDTNNSVYAICIRKIFNKLNQKQSCTLFDSKIYVVECICWFSLRNFKKWIGILRFNMWNLNSEPEMFSKAYLSQISQHAKTISSNI